MAIHCETSRNSARNNGPTLFFELNERVGRDGLYLGNDVGWPLFFNDFAYLRPVTHVECVASMSNLHRRRVLVSVAGNNLDPESHCLNGDLASELARAQEEELGGGGFERGAEFHVGIIYTEVPMSKPRLIVFASGAKEEGGSGFENLVTASRAGVLDAKIVAVVSNQEQGSVRERAKQLGVPFVYFPGPYDREHYQKIIADSGAEWVALSGWLRQAQGLDPQKTFNIHPALLSQLDHRFGGKGMYGHHIHEAVKAALDAGEISESGFTMHFVTGQMDRGPMFFEHRIRVTVDMTADEIEKAVKKAEHEWQPRVTHLVVHGAIQWDGKDPATLVVPPNIQ